MITPTTSPISSSGLETITSVRIASRATSSTSDPVIAPVPLSSPRKRGPSKREPKRYASPLQQSARSTGSPLARGRQKVSADQELTNCIHSSSDRHPHDFLVSLNHAIAHRDQRLDRHFGFRHR